MINDDNSVNIKSTKRGYHHGDLHAALVRSGLERLETRAADELSLREVARAVDAQRNAIGRGFDLARHARERAALPGQRVTIVFEPFAAALVRARLRRQREQAQRA